MIYLSIAVVLIALIAFQAFKTHIGSKNKDFDEETKKRLTDIENEIKALKTQITLRRL